MFYVGLDLGQAADYTALTITERVVVRTGVDDNGKAAFAVQQHVRHIERYPLMTSYAEVVRSVYQYTRTPQLASNYKLVADATGVGMPVVESLRMNDIEVVPVVITGGNAETFDEMTAAWHIPKKVLISNLLLLFGNRSIKISDGLKDKKVIMDELANFKMKITAKGNDTYEAWREGDHDDLVLSLALGCWYSERYGTPSVPKKQRLTAQREPALLKARKFL